MNWAARARPPGLDRTLLVLSLIAGLHAPRAHAETRPLLAHSNPLAGLVPTPAERAAAEQIRLEHQLEGALTLLPEVVAAKVVITSVAADTVPLDRELPAPRAALVLRVRGHGPDERQVLALAQSVLPAGTAVHLERSVLPEQAAAQSAAKPWDDPSSKRVGPFWVAAKSASALRFALALLLLSNALLAGLVLRRLRARR
jgi:type III secretory pathway lipoprotein EscJ